METEKTPRRALPMVERWARAITAAVLEQTGVIKNPNPAALPEWVNPDTTAAAVLDEIGARADSITPLDDTERYLFELAITERFARRPDNMMSREVRAALADLRRLNGALCRLVAPMCAMFFAYGADEDTGGAGAFPMVERWARHAAAGVINHTCMMDDADGGALPAGVDADTAAAHVLGVLARDAAEVRPLSVGRIGVLAAAVRACVDNADTAAAHTASFWDDILNLNEAISRAAAAFRAVNRAWEIMRPAVGDC